VPPLVANGLIANTDECFAPRQLIRMGVPYASDRVVEGPPPGQTRCRSALADSRVSLWPQPPWGLPAQKRAAMASAQAECGDLDSLTLLVLHQMESSRPVSN